MTRAPLILMYEIRAADGQKLQFLSGHLVQAHPLRYLSRHLFSGLEDDDGVDGNGVFDQEGPKDECRDELVIKVLKG